MAKELTDKQRSILEFIISYQKEKCFPPTIREIGNAFNIVSLRGVTVHLDALVKKGYVKRDQGASRSLRVITPGASESKPLSAAETPSVAPRAEAGYFLPLLRGFGVGELSLLSGKLDIADAVVERPVSLPEDLAVAATENGFVLRVGATGVYGEPALPGDLLVVRPQRAVQRGELAVYLSHGELSIARHTVSAEDNPVLSMPTQEIVGRVVGLVRRY